jgi:hypothetical protein
MTMIPWSRIRGSWNSEKNFVFLRLQKKEAAPASADDKCSLVNASLQNGPSSLLVLCAASLCFCANFPFATCWLAFAAAIFLATAITVACAAGANSGFAATGTIRTTDGAVAIRLRGRATQARCSSHCTYETHHSYQSDHRIKLFHGQSFLSESSQETLKHIHSLKSVGARKRQLRSVHGQRHDAPQTVLTICCTRETPLKRT